jgi:hypothetical protein
MQPSIESTQMTNQEQTGPIARSIAKPIVSLYLPFYSAV